MGRNPRSQIPQACGVSSIRHSEASDLYITEWEPTEFSIKKAAMLLNEILRYPELTESACCLADDRLECPSSELYRISTLYKQGMRWTHETTAMQNACTQNESSLIARQREAQHGGRRRGRNNQKDWRSMTLKRHTGYHDNTARRSVLGVTSRHVLIYPAVSLLQRCTFSEPATTVYL